MQNLTRSKLDKSVEIVEFPEKWQVHFARLNYHWIDKYFVIENIDRKILDNPIEEILEQGGAILFSLVDSNVVGTVALIKWEDEVYELAKMGVDDAYQNMKIGHKLMQATIEKARNLGAMKIVILSNRILVPAIYLYKKFGFEECEMEDEEYERCNIRLELLLSE